MYNRGKKRKQNPPYSALQHKALRYKKEGNVLKEREIRKAMQQMPAGDPMDEDYRRLKYVRYADDFILGFAGPKAEAEEIKQWISKFLRNRLRLDLAESKTLITHASEPARFLGYDISIGHNNDIMDGRGGRGMNGSVFLRVPQQIKYEWVAKYSKHGKPVHRAERLNDDDYDIVTQFGAELRGLTEYYKMAVNVSNLNHVKGVMMASLVKTLAAKHKMKVTTVYKKYKTVFDNGQTGIVVKVEREGKQPLYARFGETPAHYQRMVGNLNDTKWVPHLGRTQLIDRLLAEKCELCGAEGDMVGHHVHKLADVKKMYRHKVKPRWVDRMLAIRRKTLVVCLVCHREIHNGTYDGPAIK
jgi:hypothetical protein